MDRKMSRKVAMVTHLAEHQECSGCHCYAQEGYMLQDSSMSRFICSACYEDVQNQYPLASKVVEIKKEDLAVVVPEGKKPGFQAGYLIGKKEAMGDGYKIQIHKLLNSVHTGKGTVRFFNNEDVLNIRKISKETGDTMVGLYRTSPSGSPDFNSLDNQLLDELLLDIVYMMIGGNSEIQIAVRDKQCHDGEIGVMLS
jgi:hypothetical protein